VTAHPTSDTPRADHTGARGVALHARHIAVLTAIAIGLTHAAAAHRYRVSPRTVRRIADDAARRLGAANTVHAVALATAAGLLDPAHLRDRTTPPMSRSEIVQHTGWKSTETPP